PRGRRSPSRGLIPTGSPQCAGERQSRAKDESAEQPALDAHPLKWPGVHCEQTPGAHRKADVAVVNFSQPLLINILGHAGGALIFAIFLTLLYSGRGWSGLKGRYLSGLAAGLSLVWNLGSLVVLVQPHLPPLWLNLVIAVSFSVLSLLPAVLLHLSVGKSRSALVVCGYFLSAIAVGMHFWEFHGNGAALHQEALLLITIGFLVLTALAVADAAFIRGVRRPGGARIAGAMCMALFAMSFVHFGSGHAGQ